MFAERQILAVLLRLTLVSKFVVSPKALPNPQPCDGRAFVSSLRPKLHVSVIYPLPWPAFRSSLSIFGAVAPAGTLQLFLALRLVFYITQT